MGYKKGVYLPIETRFWRFVGEKLDNVCWEWQGNKNSRGYGIITDGKNKTTVYAHRISYEIHCSSIPSGMCILHKCDNPSCVNPDHLFLGTYKDNMVDMVSKGRMVSQKGELNNMSKLTNHDVKMIKQYYTTKEKTIKELSIFFDVNIRHIYRIIGGERRKDG